MSWLLDRYSRFLGRQARKQGSAYNGACPCCGGDPVKSDRFMVWPQDQDAIGKVCFENGLSGRFSCRQCGITGDTISYLEICENMTFSEAIEELGIKPMNYERKKYKPAPTFQEKVSSFVPQSKEIPENNNWLEKVEKLTVEAHSNIWKYNHALNWLANRGISEADIKKYQLGYIEPEGVAKQGRFRDRKAFGLEQKLKADGKPKKLFIPRGISIPTFRSNKLVALRIRRHQEDLVSSASGYTPPKYMEFEGSLSAPMVLLPETDNLFLACWVIVEAQFDAMLIHSMTKGMVGAVAINSNRNKPDAYTHKLLKDSPKILLALDYEESCAGIAGLDFWLETYPQSKRWPVPKGKDPGEAFQLGVDIKMWIEAGLPSSLGLAHNKLDKNGQLDTFSSVVDAIGGRGEKCDSGTLFTQGKEGLKEGYKTRCNTVEEISLFDEVQRTIRDDVDADTLDSLQATDPEAMFIQHVWFLLDTFPDGVDLVYFRKLKEILEHYKEACTYANDNF